MDTQPGQATIPHDDDPNSGAQAAPDTTALPAQTEQPAPASLPPPQSSPRNTYPDVALPAVPSMQAAPSGITEAPSPDQAAGWQYGQEEDVMGGDQPLPEDVSWTASEFVEHQKSAGWYGLLALAGLVLAAVDYFVTKDVVSTGVIILAAILFGVYAGHKPRTQHYYLSPQGLQIGEKLYTFKSFKAFSIIEEGASASIMFTPLGRFAPPLTIYVESDMEDRVLDYLGIFLPFEKRRADAVDGLLRRIRF